MILAFSLVHQYQIVLNVGAGFCRRAVALSAAPFVTARDIVYE